MAVLRFDVDEDAEMTYVKVGEGPITESVDYGLVVVDLNDEGETVGVEFFGVLSPVVPGST